MSFSQQRGDRSMNYSLQLREEDTLGSAKNLPAIVFVTAGYPIKFLALEREEQTNCVTVICETH